jgi:hypothetical protein
MRDRLRDVECPMDMIDQIGGWKSVSSIGNCYGEGYDIKKLTGWTKKMQTWPMDDEIRAEIIDFRKKLDELNGKEFSWTYTPVPEFVEKENYPMDFQIFMEEIGVFEASVDPHRQNDAYQLFRLEVPRALNTCSSDFEEGKTNLFILPYIFTDDNDDPYCVDPIIDGKNSDYFKIFGNDSSSGAYLFLTDVKPYELWVSGSFIEQDFWSCMKRYFKNSLAGIAKLEFK